MKRGQRLVCMLLLLAVPLAGCLRRRSPPPPPGPAAARAAQADDPGAQIKRGRERQVNQQLLHEIGQLYAAYIAEMGKPPARPEDFLNYIQRDAHKEYAAIKDGTLILNLKPRQDSNTILCYEKDADLNGNRLVARTDGSVQLMNEGDFQAALAK